MSSRQGQNTRALTEGALLAALTIVLYVANVYTQFLIYIIPVPVAILVVRNGLRTGGVASVVAALGVGLVLGPIDGVTVLIRVALVGLTMGVLMGRRTAAVPTLLATALASVAVVVSDFLIVAATSGLSVSQMLERTRQALTEGSSQAIALYEKMGVPAQALESFRTMTDLLPQWFQMFLPTIVLGGAMLAAVISYSAAAWVLKRTKKEVEPIPPFGEWRLSWQWSWGLIATLMLGQAASALGIGFLPTLSRNVMMSYVLLYAVMGMALAWWLLKRYNVTRGFRIFILLMVYMTPPLNWLFILAGLLDGWMDFRKLTSRA